ncbi:hypothetical protein R6V09_00585 [Streptomyces sp. W16]|uniref:hypothetical protein n=1 Tax=Streptomyces sp. W16 TaxID=3076631 RepID=UPI00295AB511|nr:hypothetical protein [Streptomyces sp. W16]MDV9168639.1 hypothetical protein [Streptomyces sp. W16]
MTVSPTSETKLRAAMARLLAGQPKHTDGALTKENLAREAGVSHATVHRATDVLAEWDTHVPHPIRRTPGELARDDTITTMRAQLTQARGHARELQGQLDALATVTATLYAENLALRRRPDGRTPGDASAIARPATRFDLVSSSTPLEQRPDGTLGH